MSADRWSRLTGLFWFAPGWSMVALSAYFLLQTLVFALLGRL